MDVKTKPKNVSAPKDKVKNKNTEEQKNPENYAVDNVEYEAKTAVQNVYSASSRYISSKLKQRNEHTDTYSNTNNNGNTKYSENAYNPVKENMQLNEPKQRNDVASQIKQKSEHIPEPQQKVIVNN